LCLARMLALYYSYKKKKNKLKTLTKNY
jgi:hypothetical protein